MQREPLERAERDAAVLGVAEVDHPGHDRERGLPAQRRLGGELRGVVASDESGHARDERERAGAGASHSRATYDEGVIFPVSHERMTARRWPIVTTLVFVVCLAVQAMLALRDRVDTSTKAEEADARAIEYYAEHPYLDVTPGELPELDEETVQVAHAAARAVEAPDDETRATEQQELDGLIAAAKRAGAVDERDPYRRFGYVPASPSWTSLFTSQFVHAGWLHLAGNMWFLFLCGMTLEDRWGRVVFPLFYLASGAAAALAHGLVHPHDTAPLVGASGAIAGCMGAFAVAFARTRVRFLLLVTLRPRTFTAPAFVVLPFWAVFEVLWGWLFPGDGTAHMAHVGGFAFGLVAALVLHWTGMDHRLDDSVQRVATLGGDPRIDEARVLVKKGDAKLALAMLEGLAQEKPDSPHVQEAIAEAARALGDDAREQKATQRAQKLRATSA
jgi:membrane associated rhomboid family serine protease